MNCSETIGRNWPKLFKGLKKTCILRQLKFSLQNKPFNVMLVISTIIGTTRWYTTCYKKLNGYMFPQISYKNLLFLKNIFDYPSNTLYGSWIGPYFEGIASFWSCTSLSSLGQQRGVDVSILVYTIHFVLSSFHIINFSFCMFIFTRATILHSCLYYLKYIKNPQKI